MIPIEVPRTIPGVTPAIRRRLQRLYRAATWIDPRLAARLALALFVTPGRGWLQESDARALGEARTSRLRFGAGHVQVYEWGRGEQAVLLLHGWSSQVARLSSFVAPLTGAGFRVVGFDAPGHGGSSGWRADLVLIQHALHVVLERCGPVQGIVAHSLGARAALRLLAARPRADVRALALLSMPPDVRHMLEQFKLVLDLRDDVAALLEAQFVRQFGRPERHRPEAHARPLALPTLVVHDRHDDVAPLAHALALAQQLPRSELLVTDSLNHCGPLRDAATIGRVVGFLRCRCDAAAPHADDQKLTRKNSSGPCVSSETRPGEPVSVTSSSARITV